MCEFMVEAEKPNTGFVLHGGNLLGAQNECAKCVNSTIK